MPTEWIHHPWNAPLNVLRAAGVDLGQNYPIPIIDIDLAREQLTEAIFKMWENKAAAKASSSEDRHEVVDDSENLDLPKVLLKNKSPRGASTSLHDQTVPTHQNPPTNKRLKCMAEVEQKQHKEMSSSAESSSKRKSSSSSSFSVPQQCSSSSNINCSWQEMSDMEQSSRKDG